MVEVGRLLEINSHHPHANAFGDCVGDRYLYARNPVYRTIRDCALAHGISYCRAGSPLWHDYTVCPLFCLDVMLQEGSIPIIDNESSLRRLMSKSGPSFAVTGKFLTKAVKRNYLLHESCHYIAYRVGRSATRAREEPIFTSDAEYQVAMALTGEAFAAVAERIAWALSESPTHILLINLNSYIDHNVTAHKLLVECIHDLGLPAICKMGMIALFVNNLKKRPVTDEELNDLLKVVFPEWQSPEIAPRLRSLVDNVFAIAPAFLEETTPAYFRMVGCEKEFLALSEKQYQMNQLEALMSPQVTSQLMAILTSTALGKPELANIGSKTGETYSTT